MTESAVSSSVETMEESASLITLAIEVRAALKKIESRFLNRLPFIQLLEYIDSRNRLLALWPIIDRQFNRSNLSTTQYSNCLRWLLTYMYKNCVLSNDVDDHIDTRYMEKLVKEVIVEAEDIDWLITDLYESVEDSLAFQDFWKSITGVNLHADDPRDVTISVKEELKSRFITPSQQVQEKKELYLHQAEKDLCKLSDCDVKALILDVFAENIHSHIDNMYK